MGREVQVTLMRALLLSAAIGLALGVASDADAGIKGCSLGGRVRFVSSAARADYSVRWVNGPADARVRFVSANPGRPGEWQETDGFADFTVYVVELGERYDFTARSVDWRPGCRQ